MGTSPSDVEGYLLISLPSLCEFYLFSYYWKEMASGFEKSQLPSKMLKGLNLNSKYMFTSKIVSLFPQLCQL